MVRRFVHFEVLCTAKYRYGKNSAADPFHSFRFFISFRFGSIS
jgi:hypothetical protein